MHILKGKSRRVMPMLSGNFVKLLIGISAIVFVWMGCQKDDMDSSEIKKEHIRGFVQKGPFINGTQILMSELNADLEQTGKLFSTQIVSNTGLFQIDDVALTSNFVEFSGSGFYFDEVKGEASVSQLTLFALSDITDVTSVNVNILTHLERRRVKYLISQDLSFAQAKKNAQSEILSMFGFEYSEMEESENLDITVDNDANAILLAVSVILQGNRSVADMTELMAQISSDLREDGVLNDGGIMQKLRTSSLQLDLGQIRQNLETRYSELGLDASIPKFESYVQTFLSFTAGEPSATSLNASDITPNEATLMGLVNPNSAVTQVIFEYGPTEAYGNEVTADQNPVNSNGNLPVQATIGSLAPATTYHYRIKAVNEHGEAFGFNQTFTTLGNTPIIVACSANPLADKAILKGIVNPNMLTTEVTFEWGVDGVFDNSVLALESPLEGNDNKAVSFEITELQGNTEYQFRIKAENELGVTLSDVVLFKTYHSTVTDYDGNVYVATQIGDQIWMSENLRTGHYQNGDVITLAQSNENWQFAAENQTEAHCSYESDILNDAEFGRFYNWYAVSDPRNICPQGWRVPGTDDWTELIISIDSEAIVNGEDYFFVESLIAADHLKSKKTMPEPQPSWVQPNNFATDSTRFSALPVGFRYIAGEFLNSFSPGRDVWYWTSDEYGEESMIWVLSISIDSRVMGHNEGNKQEGYAVRCIKN